MVDPIPWRPHPGQVTADPNLRSLLNLNQTFKSYTHKPLLHLIRSEIRAVGLMGFYFAGIPAWATAFSLSICKNHLLEPLTAFLQNQFLSLWDNDTYNRLVRRTFSVLNTA
jgi:hypothetical protein